MARIVEHRVVNALLNISARMSEETDMSSDPLTVFSLHNV
jgi:hypothetical protein